MATSYTIMLSSLLLILATTQGGCAENQGSLCHPDDVMVIALGEVKQELQRLGNTTEESLHTMQEGLRLQKQNTDALNSLPDMTLKIKEKLQNNIEIEELLKRENEALNKVIIFTQELTNLKIQLLSKDEKLNKLSQEKLGLMNQLEEKNQNVSNQNNDLDEYQRRIQELEQQVKELNKTVETERPVDWSKNCEHPRLQQIKQEVQAFTHHKDLDRMKEGLQVVLDPNSVEYSQLEAGSLHNAAYHGHTQLAFMLLCAGMPVNMTDDYGNSLMHGAAHGGHLQLVKQLIDRGASVNIRGSFDTTPLTDAAWDGHLDVVKCLVEAGADTTARTTRGENALDYARNYGHTAVVQYLEQLPH